VEHQAAVKVEPDGIRFSQGVESTSGFRVPRKRMDVLSAEMDKVASARSELTRAVT
jgi:hypothetical protein